MGVTGLWKLIDASGKPVPLEMLENKVLAVDISIWLHQVVKGFQDQKGSAVPNAHLLGLFNRLCKLLYYRIKPVFVFDGGIPVLKRETIAKRYQNKNKLQNEADRIQQLLLNSLTKEKILQQAIGGSPSKVNSKPVISPTKKNDNKAIEQDELFKLPKLDKSLVEASTSAAESDSSSDEENEVNYYRNLKAIDVNSSHFKSLPPDVRYDLLSDIKETRKHSSWATIHELPAESNDFCTFQMNRLLKRRKVQVELEETEKELGGKCLTMDVLESLLIEDGIDVDQNVAVGGQIASDENTRYILVRDLKTVIEKSNLKKEELTTIKEELATIELDVNSEEEKPKIPESKIERISLTEEINTIEDDEEFDLQRAIQLSLSTEQEITSYDEVKMSTQQKKGLSKSAKNSLARGYLLQNAGMTNEEFKELVADRQDGDETICIDSTFKYNDSFVAYGKKSVAEIEVTPDNFKKPEIELERSISSNTDSDLVDVPDADFNSSEMNIFPTFQMNSCMSDEKDASKDFRIEDLAIMKSKPYNKSESKLIEVFVKTDEIKQDEEDIFADVFNSERKVLREEEIKTPETVKTDTVNSVNNILKQLEKEKSDIIKLDLDDIQLDSHLLDKEPEINLQKILSSDAKKQVGLDDGEDSDTTIIDETLKSVRSSSSKIIQKKSEDSKELEKQVNIEIPEDKPSDRNNLKLEQMITPVVASEIVETIEIKADECNVIDLQNLNSEITKPENKVIVETPLNLEEKPINPEKLIEEAANKLRQDKTKDEIIDMISELSKEKKDLEIDKNKHDRFSASITEQMSRECKDLLKLFGIPYIVAPMEAEAQCAFLNLVNLTDGTITDDSDIWLFGGQTVYKNFFNQKKNVLEFRMEIIEKLYKMNRDKMIQIAFLTGSDYTSGINGIGAVTALEILASFPSTPEQEGETNKCMSILSGLRKFKNWFVNSKAVTTTPQKHSLKSKLKNIDISDNFPLINIVEAYLYPTVDENLDNFSWGYPDAKAIQEFARKTFGWTKLKTDETLVPVLKKLDDRKLQQSITNYFKLQATPTVTNLKVSTRVKKAINQMGGQLEIVEKPKKIKKPIQTLEINTESTTEDAIDITDENEVEPIKKPDTEVIIIADAPDANSVKPKGRRTRKSVTKSKAETTTEAIAMDIIGANDVEPRVRRKRKPAQKLSQTQDKVPKRQPTKRKTKSDVDPQPINIATTLTKSTDLQPSTSSSSSLMTRQNKSKLGDTSHIDTILHKKEVIPQRTKDEQDREDSRLRAAEIFKKLKSS